MFVFDLDGTLATATPKQLNQIFAKAKNCSADIVYATGRTKKEVVKLQKELLDKGVVLPNPKHLITNNGQYLYDNIDGQMVESLSYQNMIQAKSHYNRDVVTQTMHEIAHSDKYKYSDEELESIPNLQEVKASDPDFYNSKISYYEWNPSPNMSEYFIAHDVDNDELKDEIVGTLSEKNINVKFRDNLYSKKIMDACSDRPEILLQSNNLRRHPNGEMTALFLCAGDKSDGIEFLKNQKGVLYKDILMAGNEDNDIPMANLSEKGAKFICLKDASIRLIDHCAKIKDNIFLSIQNGADAIVSGIKHFTKKSNT